jgi:uncharacterized membrane protein
LPQLATLVSHQQGAAPPLGWTPHWQTVALVAGFWAMYLAAGLARWLRGRGVDQLMLAVLASTSTSAIAAAAVLFDGRERGWAMLTVAVVYAGLVALPRVLGRRAGELESVFGATALTAALVATGELLGGNSRAVAVSAEAGLLVWLSARFGERRFQLASLGYLAVATLLTLVQAPLVNLVDFPPAGLGPVGNPDGSLVLGSIAAAVALAASAIMFAVFSRPMGTDRRTWRRVTAASALTVSLYAMATAILDGFVWLHATQRSFENGHTVVSLAVALVGVALLVVGLRRHSTDARTGGLVLLGLAVAKLFLYDLVELNLMARAVAFIAVGLLLLAGGIVYQRLWDENRETLPASG